MTAGAAATARCAGCGAPGLADDRFCEACGVRRDDPRDHVEVPLPGLAAVSDRGHRHLHNEDAVALRVLPAGDGRGPTRIAVLCDGVSSAPRPDLASLAAADAVADALAAPVGDTGATEAMAAAARAGAAAVVDAGTSAGLPGPSACTFVAAVVVDGVATIGWLGDSRAYWLPRGGEPGRALTTDDSWLAGAVAAGVMTPADAAGDARAHAITAWLGAGPMADAVHVTTLDPAGAGTLLLCTDGLWNDHPSAEALAAVLTTDPASDPLAAARELVAAALQRGGRDNATAAVLPMAGPGTGTAEATP